MTVRVTRTDDEKCEVIALYYDLCSINLVITYGIVMLKFKQFHYQQIISI